MTCFLISEVGLCESKQNNSRCKRQVLTYDANLAFDYQNKRARKDNVWRGCQVANKSVNLAFD